MYQSHNLITVHPDILNRNYWQYTSHYNIWCSYGGRLQSFLNYGTICWGRFSATHGHINFREQYPLSVADKTRYTYPTVNVNAQRREFQLALANTPWFSYWSGLLLKHYSDRATWLPVYHPYTSGIWHSEDRASWYILIIEANEMHYFSNLFDKVLYMLWTSPLSIIRMADGNVTNMTNTYCCQYRIETPDDGQ